MAKTGNWVYTSFSKKQSEKIAAHKWEAESMSDTFFRLLTNLNRAIAAGKAPKLPSLVGERPKISHWYCEDVERLAPPDCTFRRAIAWSLELPVQKPVQSADELLRQLRKEFAGEFQVSADRFLSAARLYTPVKRTNAFKVGLLKELRDRREILMVIKGGKAYITLPLPMPILTSSEVRRLLVLSPKGKRAEEIEKFTNLLPVQVVRKDGAIAGVISLPSGIDRKFKKTLERSPIQMNDFPLPEFGKVWKSLVRQDGTGGRNVRIVLRSSQEVLYVQPGAIAIH